MTINKHEGLNEDFLIWCDLETGGLEPRKDPILEIGFSIFDIERQFIVDTCAWVIRPTLLLSTQAALRVKEMKVEELRKTVDPYVDEMHEKNGLWDEIEIRGQGLADVGRQIPDWFQMNGLDLTQKYRAAGSGFDRFDRKFLEHNSRLLKNIDKIFHYASLDVSAMRRGLQLANVDVQRHLGEHTESSKAHRSTPDMHWDIETWKRMTRLLNVIA